jgi:hypothetical protein
MEVWILYGDDIDSTADLAFEMRRFLAEGEKMGILSPKKTAIKSLSMVNGQIYQTLFFRILTTATTAISRLRLFDNLNAWAYLCSIMPIH